MAESDEFQAEPPRRRRPAPHAQPRRRRDEYDDEDIRRPEDDAVSTLIPYRNPKALAAYYCGVFGLIPCVGAILGPIALIFGILGLRYVKEHPTAKGTGHAIAGIVLGIIELTNWVVIVFLIVALITGAGRR